MEDRPTHPSSTIEIPYFTASRAARVSEHRVLPLALAFNGRAPFASLQRRAEMQLLRSHAHRRPTPQLSEHPALLLALALIARAPSRCRWSLFSP